VKKKMYKKYEVLHKETDKGLPNALELDVVQLPPAAPLSPLLPPLNAPKQLASPAQKGL
jgi:hypothetical protein